MALIQQMQQNVIILCKYKCKSKNPLPYPSIIRLSCKFYGINSTALRTQMLNNISIVTVLVVILE